MLTMAFHCPCIRHAEYRMSLPLHQYETGRGTSLQGEAGRASLREAVGTGEFFLAIMPDGRRLVSTISGSQRHPIPFGREAAAELAGVPDRADWKACQVCSQSPILGQGISRLETFLVAFELLTSFNPPQRHD